MKYDYCSDHCNKVNQIMLNPREIRRLIRSPVVHDLEFMTRVMMRLAHWAGDLVQAARIASCCTTSLCLDSRLETRVGWPTQGGTCATHRNRECRRSARHATHIACSSVLASNTPEVDTFVMKLLAALLITTRSTRSSINVMMSSKIHGCFRLTEAASKQCHKRNTIQLL